MAKIDNTLLKSKFRGCLLGALLGDCLGSPFEGDQFTAGTKGVLQKNIDKLEGPSFKGLEPRLLDWLSRNLYFSALQAIYR